MTGAPVAVGPLYGSFYFAAVISVGFYGVTCMQTFFYYIHYQDDKLRLKAIVAILWALDTIHQALLIAGVYKYLMLGFVNPSSIFGTVFPEMVTLILETAQAFFIYRIYMFSDKKIIIILLWLPFGLWELVAILRKEANSTVSALGDAYFTGISISYNAVAAGVDISIAFCLTFLLARTRRKIASGFKSTAKVLQLLTVFAINTGIWTATFALLTITLMRAYPTELTYNVFGFPVCSIYCNTLLANLNARAYINSQSSAVTGSDLITVGADLVTDTGGANNNPNGDE